GTGPVDPARVRLEPDHQEPEQLGGRVVPEDDLDSRPVGADDRRAGALGSELHQGPVWLPVCGAAGVDVAVSALVRHGRDLAPGSDVGLQRHWSARVRPEPVPGPERGRPAEQPGGRPADRYYLQRSRGPERPERAPADGAAGPGHGHVRNEVTLCRFWYPR